MDEKHQSKDDSLSKNLLCAYFMFNDKTTLVLAFVFCKDVSLAEAILRILV